MGSNPPSQLPEPQLIPQGEYAGKPGLKLRKPVVVIGGAEHCHLHLVSSSVSRHHALVIKDQDGVYIRDLGSRTKVVVNGQPQREAMLVDGDVIQIGRFSFKFADAIGAGSAANPAPAKISVSGQPAPVAIEGRTLLIGRGEGCEISLTDEAVSSRHAVIFTVQEKRFIRDLDSRTGTFFKGKEVHQQEIKPGDEFRIGEATIKLAEPAKAKAPEAKPAAVKPPEMKPAEAKPAVVKPAAMKPAKVEEPIPIEPAAEAEAEPVLESAPLIPEIDPLKELLQLDSEPETAAEPSEPAVAAQPEAVSSGDTQVLEALAAAAAPEAEKATEPSEPAIPLVDFAEAPANEPEQPIKIEPEPQAAEPVAESPPPLPVQEAIPISLADEEQTPEPAPSEAAAQPDAEAPATAESHDEVEAIAKSLGSVVEQPAPISFAEEPEPVEFSHEAQPAAESAPIELEPEPEKEKIEQEADPVAEAPPPPAEEAPIAIDSAEEPPPAASEPQGVPIEIVSEAQAAKERHDEVAIAEPVAAVIPHHVSEEPSEPRVPVAEPVLASIDLSDVPELPAPVSIEPEPLPIPAAIDSPAAPLSIFERDYHQPPAPIVAVEPPRDVEPISLPAEPLELPAIPEFDLSDAPELPQWQPIEAIAGPAAIPSEPVITAAPPAEKIEPVELPEEISPIAEAPVSAQAPVEMPAEPIAPPPPSPAEETAAFEAPPPAEKIEPLELPEQIAPSAETPAAADTPVEIPAEPEQISPLAEVPLAAETPAEIPAEPTAPLLSPPPEEAPADEAEPEAESAPPILEPAAVIPEPVEAPAIADSPIEAPSSEAQFEAPLVNVVSYDFEPSAETAELQFDAGPKFETIQSPGGTLAPVDLSDAPGAPEIDFSDGESALSPPQVLPELIAGESAAEPELPVVDFSGVAGSPADSAIAQDVHFETTEPLADRPASQEIILDSGSPAPAAEQPLELSSESPEVFAQPPQQDAGETRKPGRRSRKPAEPKAPKSSRARVKRTPPKSAIEETAEPQVPAAEAAPSTTEAEIAPPVNIEPTISIAPPPETEIPQAPEELIGEMSAVISSSVDESPQPAGEPEPTPAIPAPEDNAGEPVSAIPIESEPIAPIAETEDRAGEFTAVTSSASADIIQPTTDITSPAASEPEDLATDVTTVTSSSPIEIQPPGDQVQPAGPRVDTIEIPNSLIPRESEIGFTSTDQEHESYPEIPPPPPPPRAIPMSYMGGGAVNLDHFLGGMPIDAPDDPHLRGAALTITGGMPIQLPKLPPPPPWFGQVKIDWEGKPPAPMMPKPEPTLIEAPPPSPPPIIMEPPPQEPAPAPVMPVAEAPAPVAPAAEAAPPPPPKIEPAAARPAPPQPKAPPPRKSLFSSESKRVGLGNPAANRRTQRETATPSTAFDGLAMPVLPGDVFSQFDSVHIPINDAAFGGAPLAGDIQIPESPEFAKRRAETEDLDRDFAADDFWNQTDDETNAPAAPPVQASTIESPVIEPFIPDPLPESEPVEEPQVFAKAEPPPIITPPLQARPEEPPPIVTPPVETPPVETPPVEDRAEEPKLIIEPPAEDQSQEPEPIAAPPIEDQAEDFEPIIATPIEDRAQDPPPIVSPPVESEPEAQEPQPVAAEYITPPIVPPPVESPAAEARIPAGNEPPPADIGNEDTHFDDSSHRPESPLSPLEDTQMPRNAEIEQLIGSESHNGAHTAVADEHHEDAEHLEPVGAGAGGNPPPKRRRFRIPFLMTLVLLAIAGAIAAIWWYIPVQEQVTGRLTFDNYNYVPGTQDAIQFESAQRRLLDDDQTRRRAVDALTRTSPNTSAGFLGSPDLFGKVASTVSFSATGRTPAQTTMEISRAGADKEGDRLRMLALLQALFDANAPQVDANRRARDAEQQAQRLVDEDQQKLDEIKNQIGALQGAIDAQPAVDDFNQLLTKKSELQRDRLDAENAVNRDRADISRLQAAAANASTQPDFASDAQIVEMHRQLKDLTAELDAARSDQASGAILARQQLEKAVKQFNDQIDSANQVLDGGSQLRQFVDSAMDSQAKARDLINMLIVDGEDLEKQLEDTRRDVEDLIESRQAEKWANDSTLQELRENLESAQHRYNANVGQGVTDPRILDPLQKEIDTDTAQVRQRQQELGVDPNEIKVQEGLNNLIQSLRNKLLKEKEETDSVLDPLQKQLSNLDPVVAAMPAAEQDLARQIRQRLEALNDARTKYTQSVGQEQVAASPKVADLQNQITELKTQLVSRQAKLTHDVAARIEAQRTTDLTGAQTRLASDQKTLDAATQSYATALSAFQDAAARRDAAVAAQQKKISLLDDQRVAFTDSESAKRDRDDKQAAADRAFDLEPISDADVMVVAPTDPRLLYSAIVLGAGLLIMAGLGLASHQAGRRRHGSNKPALMPDDLDSLVIPLAGQNSSDEMHQSDLN